MKYIIAVNYSKMEFRESKPRPPYRSRRVSQNLWHLRVIRYHHVSENIIIAIAMAIKWGYAQKVTSLSELLRNADEKLLSKMRSNNHSIHQLLPLAKTLPMRLRSTHCVFALPQCNYNLYKSSLVLRNLFLDAYWNILFLHYVYHFCPTAFVC